MVQALLQFVSVNHLLCGSITESATSDLLITPSSPEGK